MKYLPRADYLEFTIPETHCVLVSNEGSSLSLSLIQSLKEQGNKVVALNLPDVANPISQNAISLEEVSDTAIENALTLVRQQYGKIGTFIHLHPHFEFNKPNFTEHFGAEKQIVKTLFFLAKHLQKDLNELGAGQRANFLTVTRMDGLLGQGKRGNTSIIGGGIPGLVKCLNLEWSPVFCRAVDIQPELPIEQITEHIIGELHDPNVSIVEVAISEEARQTTIAKPTTILENQYIETRVTPNSVFLVSGGAKGVTATCVIEMAKTFQCKFILLGRSEFDVDIPSFAINEEDEGALKRLIMNDFKERGEKPNLAKVKSIFKKIVAKKEIDQTLSKITQYGGQAIYIKGDVTDSSSFQAALLKATKQLGNITGIIHGAGRLADKYIQDKTESDFENVLSVKLEGLLSLLKAVNLNQLDHLILFSSVAGFYGNVGQTDYAIANEILSKAAHLFKTNHPKTQVSAINWGAWDSGMVSGELKAQFEAAGISLVNSEGGAAMLVNELNTDYAHQAQVIIGGTLPAAVSHIGPTTTHRIHRKIVLKDNPFLNHHTIQGNPVLPVVNAAAWMAQSCEKLFPDFTIFKVEDTRLFKGIIFDGKQKEDYILEIKELEKSQDSIRLETTVFSEGNKLPTYHYKASIQLINKKQIPPNPKFTHNISGSYQATAGSILYQDDTLFHGKHFQGIEEVLDCTESQLVLSCKAPSVPLSAQGQFPIHSINTYFADIQYQGMLVWVQKILNGAKSLPLQTKAVTFYKQVPFNQKLFVNISIQETTETQMLADCTVYDEAGNVYIQTQGAMVTISKQLVW